MFELMQSVSIDAGTGTAQGKAIVPADHPLFGDHFPGIPLLPGSLLIELAAQVAGLLAEEVARLRPDNERWALLGMIRQAKFLRPVSLPATIILEAEIGRAETSNSTLQVRALVKDELVMTAELVMMMVQATADWDTAVRARYQRLSSWKGAA